ncbi:MAG: NAD-binding protein [Sulfurimonas sp.]|nr:NAD-binding protein [Sulfurimonas sp.]
MKHKNALIFGHNEYSIEIVKNISGYYDNIYIFKLDDSIKKTNINNIMYEVFVFDLTDDWDDLDKRVDINECVTFCTLEDMAENIFLTISLRDTFKDISIISLAKDKESATKLKLAGASSVFPLTQTTANIIVEMLEKPIVTEVLHNILYEQSDLQIAQIKVQNHHLFEEKYPAEIDWSKEHNIIVISVLKKNNFTEFIYSAKAKHSPIKNGDVFIVVGYEKDIVKFEKLIGSRYE